MIEYLRGVVLAKSPDHVVLDVNGVGYGLKISASTFRDLPAEGEGVELRACMLVREDAIQLVGFLTAEEREVFLILLEAKGWGPKIALAALSHFGVGRLAQAVADRDLKLLATAPGVGTKSAERLVVDVQTKLAPYARAVSAKAIAARQGPGEPGAGPAPVGKVAEAIAAMEALGCKPPVARKAIEKALENLGADADVTDLIREGLRNR